LQDLCADAETLERAACKWLSHRDAQHHQHRVGIGDHVSRPARCQILAHPDSVAAQDRRDALARGAHCSNQAMHLVGGCEPHFKTADLDDQGAHVGVRRAGFKPVAQLAHRERPAPQ
jgi:hypothetical protein